MLVTTTFTVPAACAGVVAVIEVPLTTMTLVADAPPKVTLAPEAKFVPVIVTAVPPLVVPDVGETAVGAGGDDELCRLPWKATICITQVPPLSIAVAA